MSTTAVETKSTKKNDRLPDGGLLPASDANLASKHMGPDTDGFLTIEIDRPMFKAEMFLTKKAGELVERYEGPICQGYVLGSVSMPAALDPDTGELRPWNAYVIQLTVPTKAVDRGNVLDKGVGEVVLVAETSQLRQALDPAAVNHPTKMAQIKIIPVERKPQPDDVKRKMWHTIVRVHPVLVDRLKSQSGNAILSGLIASAKQLAG